jgi:hypothetical protein
LKYRNFRIIGQIIGALAWIVALGGFILGIYVGVVGVDTEGEVSIAVDAVSIIFGLGLGLVFGLFSFLFLYAFSQFIYAIIDIEQNTREMLSALFEEGETEESE